MLFMSRRLTCHAPARINGGPEREFTVWFNKREYYHFQQGRGRIHSGMSHPMVMGEIDRRFLLSVSAYKALYEEIKALSELDPPVVR